jgi:hypothetical protein
MPVNNWDIWANREKTQNRNDCRVQAIRCSSCHRLRPHPRNDVPHSRNCGCGGIEFHATLPHPDEEAIARKLYDRELQERGTYTAIAREITNDWRAKHPVRGDIPKRVRIYSK